MLQKLIRAAFISTAATIGSVLLLRHLESKAQGQRIAKAFDRPESQLVDADRMSQDHQEALLRELDAQL